MRKWGERKGKGTWWHKREKERDSTQEKKAYSGVMSRLPPSTQLLPHPLFTSATFKQPPFTDKVGELQRYQQDSEKAKAKNKHQNAFHWKAPSACVCFLFSRSSRCNWACDLLKEGFLCVGKGAVRFPQTLKKKVPESQKMFVCFCLKMDGWQSCWW